MTSTVLAFVLEFTGEIHGVSMNGFTIVNESLLWLSQVIYKPVIIDHAIINILIHTILVLFWYFYWANSKEKSLDQRDIYLKSFCLIKLHKTSLHQQCMSMTVIHTLSEKGYESSFRALPI